MDAKLKSNLSRVVQDKSRGNFSKALKRLDDLLLKFPREFELYLEGADICLEAGEPLQAIQFLKRAGSKFSSERERINEFVHSKVRNFNDPALGKYLLESAIKRRDLTEATASLDLLQDHTVRELLKRTRIKKQSLATADQGANPLKGEILLNTLSESLLCLRLGRIKEAISGILQTLDDKPVENRVLQPFLAELEKKMPRDGRVRLALACSLIASHDYDMAMNRMISAARLDSSLIEECLSRLRALTENAEEAPPGSDDALVQLLLINGDIDRAAAILTERLEESPEQAPELMELLRPYLEEVETTLILDYLYMDAAIACDKLNMVVETMKRLVGKPENRPDLLEWLGTRSKEKFLPPELMIMHGELAIGEKKYDEALEVLKAVCAVSHPDIPTVLRMIEPHLRESKDLKSFYDEKSSAQENTAASRADDGMDFEHFENKEFAFSSKAPESELELERESAVDDVPGKDLPQSTAGTDEIEDTEDSVFDNFSGRSIFRHSGGSSDENQLRNDDDLTLGSTTESYAPANQEGEAIVWEVEGDGEIDDEPAPEVYDEAEETPPAKNVNRDRPEIEITASRDEAEEAPPAEDVRPDQPEIEITASYIHNVAKALHLSGAATFFHVGDDEDDEDEIDSPAIAPTSEAPDEDKEETAVVADTSDAVAAASKEDMSETAQIEPPTFESRFQEFLDGGLENSETMKLIEDALSRESLDELRELLYFEPSNDHEEIEKCRYQVEYHILRGRPASALEILESIKPSNGRISKEQMRSIRYRKAICQRMMNDYSAAHKTLTQLAEEFTDWQEVQTLAKTNYEQYLQYQCDETLTLEKTTSLKVD